MQLLAFLYYVMPSVTGTVCGGVANYNFRSLSPRNWEIHCATHVVARRNKQGVKKMATTHKMSHWSSSPQIRTNHTDHWSKLKSKSYYLTQIPTGHYISYCRLPGYDSHGNKYTRRPFEMATYHTVNPYGYSHHSGQHLCGATDQAGACRKRKNKSRNTLALVGCPELSRQLSEFGTLQLPTPHQWLTGTGQAKPRRVPSASSCRAKQGFKYWPQEKPQSSSNSKRTVGSSGTFLGIGIPRL